jgi:ferredoxin-NADP reductase
VENIVSQYPDADFYICGSKLYDEAIKFYLSSCGIKEERVHSEQFDNAVKRPQALMAGSVITLLLAPGKAGGLKTMNRSKRADSLSTQGCKGN